MAGAWDAKVDEVNRKRREQEAEIRRRAAEEMRGGMVNSRVPETTYTKFYQDRSAGIPTPSPYAGDWSKIGKATGKFAWEAGVVEPVKSFARTLSGDNARRYLLPGGDSGWAAKFGAVGEDLLNVASVVPFVGAGVNAVKGTAAATRATNALARAKGALNPSVSLDNYFFHGGPRADDLVGGVIDPDFVRGGAKYSEKWEPLRAPSLSVLTGPNALEDSRILEIASRNPEFAKQNADIIDAIKRGQNHGTMVDTPSKSYSHFGALHVLNVPPNQRLRVPGSPSGEVAFWGPQKPVVSIDRPQDGWGLFDEIPSNKDIPLVDPASRKTPEIEQLFLEQRGKINPEERVGWQAVIDDADANFLKSRAFSNLWNRLRGVNVTPAYKQLVIDQLNKNFGNLGLMPTKIDAFGNVVEDYGAYAKSLEDGTINPVVQNIDELRNALAKAKSQEEVQRILGSLRYNDDLVSNPEATFNMNSQLRGNIDGPMLNVLRAAYGLDGSYSRPGLRDIRRR